MTNANDKLKLLLTDIFMMEEELYLDENGPEQIEGWDSLATVSMAVALQQEFGHHMTIEEVSEIHTIGDIKEYLRSKGVEL
ncbi:acyl carrier protein [Paenibacillus sp. MBLB2552]|uniref:Acyl carrier protein n=1 Tax=Paenibacillus mellifer TaxID=2937794 RepID=A0A9X2BR48_9BACL|nr:phosphopantetheine-binding protein [Paenibacillus mellifer]MCK8489033.1 acyl carrier protein [Paenibacillus mellifer]